MNELAAQSTAPDEWPAVRSIAAARLQETGVAGAGGAGFPTYAKWERLDDVEYLLMNHQESEPNYRIDRWLAATHPQVFADLFEVVLSQVLDVVVIAAKQKDRSHLRPLENATDGRVVLPEDLPIDASSESGVVFAYTDDTYQYGMESVLLNTVANTVLSEGVPMDHGWLVQNTETLFNIQAAFREERPVTRKYVHVDGANVTHRFLDVPIGTPASDVLAAAGPYAATAEGLVTYNGDAWRRVAGGDCTLVAADGTRAHAVSDDGLLARRDGDWRVRELPVDAAIADLTHGESLYAVTVDGTFLVFAPSKLTPDGRGGWGSRALGVREVTGVAVP